jgi:hypothetical protein
MKKILILGLILSFMIMSGCTNEYQSCSTDCERICFIDNNSTRSYFMEDNKTKWHDVNKLCKRQCFELCRD